MRSLEILPLTIMLSAVDRSYAYCLSYAISEYGKVDPLSEHFDDSGQECKLSVVDKMRLFAVGWICVIFQRYTYSILILDKKKYCWYLKEHILCLWWAIVDLAHLLDIEFKFVVNNQWNGLQIPWRKVNFFSSLVVKELLSNASRGSKVYVELFTY